MGPVHKVPPLDDLIATGGTAAAAVEHLTKAGAGIVGCSFLIELSELGGRKALGVDRVHPVITY